VEVRQLAFIKQKDDKPDDPCDKGDHTFIEVSRTENYNGTVSVIGRCKCGMTTSHLAR
jgi:hypothetical protein